jgi:hypothetical protein
MAKADLDQELLVLINKLKPSLDIYTKIVLSLEENFEQIVDLLVENEKQEMDLSELTDDEIKKELREVTDELKEHFRRNKVIAKRLMDKFKLEMKKEDNVRTKTKRDLETVMRLSNRLSESLISEIVAELEVLEDEYRFEKDENGVNFTKTLAADLEELVDRSFDVSAMVEAELDIDLDTDEEIEQEFQKQQTNNRLLDFSR